jgi:hypothetical protein
VDEGEEDGKYGNLDQSQEVLYRLELSPPKPL